MLDDIHITLQNNLFVSSNVDVCFINNLPPELLSRILEVGAADGADVQMKKVSREDEEGDEEETDDLDVPFPILVSRVCRLWRIVAFSTPSLWTTIVVAPEARPPYERISMLLERSKGFPVDICVTCDPAEHEDDDEERSDDVEFLFSMLTPHIHRWRTVHVILSDYDQMDSFLSSVSDPSITAAPQLTTLELYYPQSDRIRISQDFNLFGGSTPLLTRLVIWAVPVDWNQPWISFASNLKDLELAFHPENIRPSWAQFSTILRSAPGLERLSLRRSGPSGDPAGWFIEPTPGSPADLNAPVELLRVTDFVLAFHSQTYAIGLLRKFYLPALKNLALEFHGGNYTNLVRSLAGPATSLSAAKERSCSLLSGLESLKIGGLPCHTSSIETLYGEPQNLTSLDLSLPWSLPMPFIHVLCIPCEFLGRGGVWMPRLVTLYISTTTGDVIREIVRRRRDAGVPLKLVYVRELCNVNEEDVEWLKENVKTFRFKRRG